MRRLLSETEQFEDNSVQALEAQPEVIERRIEHRLDRIEAGHDSNVVWSRLKAREDEAVGLRQTMSDLSKAESLVVPSEAELEQAHDVVIADLEGLLTDSDQLVEANTFLKEIILEIRVFPAPDNPDGVRLEIITEAAHLFGNGLKNQRDRSEGRFFASFQISVAAGAGFGLSRTPELPLPPKGPSQRTHR